ncbi:hypothetical protein ACLOJK_001472 [Asimina triloba]
MIVLRSRGNFNEKYLTSAIRFEAERGYRNAFGQTMRFSTFLHSNLLKLCSRSNHKSAQRLLDEADFYGTASISDRSNILNKYFMFVDLGNSKRTERNEKALIFTALQVSVLMGYCNVQDLIEHEKDCRESDADLKGSEEDFDISFACRRFPSIILGSSPFVELYDDDVFQPDTVKLLPEGKCGEFFPSSIGGYCIPPDKLSEKWLKFGDQEITYMIHADGDGRQSNLVRADEVRKLLQLFPRTYADLQNAHGVIDDGGYFMFVGKVLSSRGIKASYSFSFLEVIVGCEIASEDGTSETEAGYFRSGGKKLIHLHLKKFFRGARFTNVPFLKSLSSKHKEGDIVKEMKQKDHYEMREYTIDMLESGESFHIHGEGRPYPLYPAKGGQNPSFLRDTISRSSVMLSMLDHKATKITTMPIHQLHVDAYVGNHAYFGIHCPKNLKEADLARKRLVFDEFFYLQNLNLILQNKISLQEILLHTLVKKSPFPLGLPITNGAGHQNPVLGRLFQMLEGLGTQIEKDGLLERHRNHEPSTISVDSWSNLTRKLLNAFPYALTSSQLNAVSEIIWDLKRPLPMNRLLQGDVGCGKTVVAFLACMEVISLGYQAAFMVPTELLAVQHYEQLHGLIENMEQEPSKPSIALLTGSTPAKQARIIRKACNRFDLQTGDIALVIGTHSLMADSVEFAALRIAVVDEQHRFGVIQRGKFSSKLYSAASNFSTSDSSWNQSTGEKVHMAPHILAISATPIPRTLALALYGDMSLTQITDLPPGRLAIETFVLEGNESGLENVYQGYAWLMMQEDLVGGGKVYLVYPVIDESEQLPQLHAAAADLESISSKFKDYQCGLLHGRMKSDEKGEALQHFRSGETKILLSTQVIEIGVDVPDASMMVVMNAERFGIAQLHQLRGRVGRGTRKSKCVFLASSSGAVNRLKVLEKSSDGFHLANVDLMIRGPGDLLGKKQSGHLPEFPIARLEIDGSILQDAHLAALKVLSASHDLKNYPKLKAELSMRHPLCLLGD